MPATKTAESTDADILAAWTAKIAEDNGWTIGRAQTVMLNYLRDTEPATADTISTPHLKTALDVRPARVATCNRCADGTACTVGFELDELLTFEGSLIQDAQERGHSEGVERLEAVGRGDMIVSEVRLYTDGVLTGRRPMTLTVDRRWMTGLDSATVVSDGKSVDAIVASSIRIVKRNDRARY